MNCLNCGNFYERYKIYVGSLGGTLVKNDKMACKECWDNLLKPPFDDNRFKNHIKKWHKKRFEKSQYNWITISPPENVPFSAFVKFAIKLFNKAIVRGDPERWLCFEWRHNGSKNKGLHLHMYSKGTTHRIRSELKRSCKGWIIKVQKTIFTDKKEYCSIKINDISKRPSKAKDVFMRWYHRVPHYINCGNVRDLATVK